jgi:hypothetical protein
VARKAAEGIPLISAIVFEIIAYLNRHQPPIDVPTRTYIVRERGRYTLALVWSSFAVAAVYSFVEYDFTLFVSILIYLVVASFFFLYATLERFTGLFRLLALVGVSYVILFEIDPVGLIARLFGFV